MALALMLFLAISYHFQNHVGPERWRRGSFQEELKLPGYSDTEHCRTYRNWLREAMVLAVSFQTMLFPDSVSWLPTPLPYSSKQASVGCARISLWPLYFKQLTCKQLGSKRCCFLRAVHLFLTRFLRVCALWHIESNCV